VSEYKLDYKNIAFYIIIIIAIVFVTMYFLNVWCFKDNVTLLFSKISLPKLPEINLNSLISWATQNTALIGVVAGLGTTAITYFVKNYQTNKLLNQSNTLLTEKMDEINQTQLTLSAAEAKAKNLEDQLNVFKDDTTAEELQKRLSSLSSEKTQLEATISSIQSQNQQLMNEIKNRPVQIVKEHV